MINTWGLLGRLALAGVLSLGGGSALAAGGDWMVRVGGTNVNPNADSDEIAGTGSEVDIDDAWAVGFTISYFITDNWAVELLGSSPFEHTIEGDGGAIDGVDVSEIKHLPPTLNIQYHLPFDNGLKPYAGAGLTYLWIFDEDNEVDGLDVDVDSTWGPGVQAGVDYNFTPNWLVNADIRYMWLDTDADISGIVNDDIDVDVDPWVFTLAMGYRF